MLAFVTPAEVRRSFIVRGGGIGASLKRSRCVRLRILAALARESILPGRLTLALTGPPPPTPAEKESLRTAGPVERVVEPHGDYTSNQRANDRNEPMRVCSGAFTMPADSLRATALPVIRLRVAQ